MREELTEIIGYEMADPRVKAAEITEVHLSPDLRSARVLITVSGTPQDQGEVLAALSGARHFLRRQLAGRLQLFRTPELHFEPAAILGAAPKIESLFRRIRRGRPRPDETCNEDPTENSP